MTVAGARRRIIGVMGPGDGAAPADCERARTLGALIAREGWILLCGGRPAGVMEAACRGAQEAGGLTIGILPDDDPHGASAHVAIPILTGMGNARNNINVLSSDVVIACGMGAGTASEVALAIKAGRPVVLLGGDETARRFFAGLGGALVQVASDPDDAVRLARTLPAR